MIRKVRRMLDGIRWDGGDVADFLGCYLTEPKAHVVFTRPARPLTARGFAAAVARRGLRLAPATRMLFRGDTVFMNGEACATGTRAARALTAPRRPARAGARIPARARRRCSQLYEWYRAGYIILGDE